MGNEPSSEDEAALILRFAAGEDRLIGELQGRLGGVMAGMANELLGRHRVNRSVYSEDDAVNDAECDLCKAARAGKLGSVRTRDDLLNIFRSLLKRRILDRHCHDSATRHGGPGLSRPGRKTKKRRTTGAGPASGRGFDQVEGGLDDLCTGAPSPVDWAIGKDDRETLAMHLNDPALKIILHFQLAGRSQPEIAHRMGKSLSFVETGVKRIRSAWAKINPKPK